jgi:hypothetical protein
MSRVRILVGLACILSLLVATPIVAQQGKKYGKLYLKEYKAKTPDEAAIIKLLIQYQDAWNSHDIQKFISLFAKGGTYMPCSTYTTYPIASQKCQDATKTNFGTLKFETYYDPLISVNGDKAVVKALIETGAYLADYTFTLQRNGKDWLVQDARYANDHYKG